MTWVRSILLETMLYKNPLQAAAGDHGVRMVLVPEPVVEAHKEGTVQDPAVVV